MTPGNSLRLYCPFDSRISPEADALESLNIAWLLRFQLVDGPDETIRIASAKFGQLAARAYPDAPIDLLGIAAAWATWLFLRDDECDEGGIASDPAALRVLSDRQIDVLAGQPPRSGDTALTAALADLRQRMFLRGGGRWMSRFLNSVQDYFDASVWEAENREAGRVPDVETYLRLRDLTGAVKTCFDIFELADRPLPVDVRYDERLAELMQLANRAICWANDIFSVHKEVAHGDVHNLVTVLQHGTQASLEDAVSAAAKMHDAAVQRFERLGCKFQETNPAPQVRRFVEALKGWVRANLDWSIETGRYSPTRTT